MQKVYGVVTAVAGEGGYGWADGRGGDGGLGVVVEDGGASIYPPDGYDVVSAGSWDEGIHIWGVRRGGA